MLILRREADQDILVGPARIKVLSISPKGVRLGVTAPRGMPVHRSEVAFALGLKKSLTGVDEDEVDRIALSVPQL